ncbi:MAG: O-antigen ligase family protein [Candidatus Wallbacteria bacterium]|nr:O-antigen ligase family protein [Candidatus Wallbacteria bacterium]
MVRAEEYERPGGRALDLSLFLLAVVITVTPLAITGATYNIEAIKQLVFQGGVALLLLAAAVRRESAFGFGRGLDYAVIGYFAIHFAAFMGAELKDSGLAQLHALAYQVLFYLLVRSMRLQGRRFDWLASCWLGAAAAASAVAIAQVVLEQHVRFGAAWQSRATGTFIQPTFLGAYLAATLPLAVSRVLRSAQSRRLAAGVRDGAVLAAMIVAITFSLSRSGWVGACAGLGAMVLVSGRLEALRRAAVPLMAGIFVAIWVALLWRPPSALDLARLDPRGGRSNRERLEIWIGSARLVAEKPLLGWGPGNFGPYFPRRWTPYLQTINSNEGQRPMHAHSEPLHVAVEAGLLGALGWLILVGWSGWVLVGMTRSPDPGERELGQIHVGALAAVLLNACVGLDQRFPTSGMLLWYLIGFAASRQPPRAPAPAPAPAHPEPVEGCPVEPLPRESPSRFRQAFLAAIAVYLLWLSVQDFRAERWKMQGAIRHYSGHHEQAESYLAAAAELRPWDAEIFFLRGRNFSEVRAWRRAEECYLESQRLDPNNAALLFNGDTDDGDPDRVVRSSDDSQPVSRGAEAATEHQPRAGRPAGGGGCRARDRGRVPPLVSAGEACHRSNHTVLFVGSPRGRPSNERRYSHRVLPGKGRRRCLPAVRGKCKRSARTHVSDAHQAVVQVQSQLRTLQSGQPIGTAAPRAGVHDSGCVRPRPQGRHPRAALLGESLDRRVWKHARLVLASARNHAGCRQCAGDLAFAPVVMGHVRWPTAQ